MSLAARSGLAPEASPRSSLRIAQPHDWIAELPARVRRDVRARMSVISVDAGEVITETGSPAVSIHQVASGYVKLLKDLPSGDQVLLAVYVPGNAFGESAVVVGRNHHHTTVAATPATLSVLTKADFDLLYGRHQEIPETLCRKIANAMSLMLENRETTSLHDVRTQVALVFCNLADSCAVDTDDASREIGVPLTVSDIADFLGRSRQTVQKAVSFLKTGGILTKTSGRWTVTDRVALRRLAGEAG